MILVNVDFKNHRKSGHPKEIAVALKEKALAGRKNREL